RDRRPRPPRALRADRRSARAQQPAEDAHRGARPPDQRDRQAEGPDCSGAGEKAGRRDATGEPQRGGAPARSARAAASRGHLPALGEAGRRQGDDRRLRAVECARVDTDAQHRRLAMAREARARRDQARDGSRRAQGRGDPHEPVHAQFPHEARPAGGAACASAGQGSAAMTLDDFRRLNLREVGKWPLGPRIVVLLAILIAILALAGWFDWKDQWDRLTSAQQDEVRLKAQFVEKKAKAINYDLYVQQLAEVNQAFGALVKQLPNRSEMIAFAFFSTN